jgi:hypothetical protein
LGAWLGELPHERAAALRPPAPVAELGADGAVTAAVAERTWLDGLLGFANRDVPAALALLGWEASILQERR